MSSLSDDQATKSFATRSVLGFENIAILFRLFFVALQARLRMSHPSGPRSATQILERRFTPLMYAKEKKLPVQRAEITAA